MLFWNTNLESKKKEICHTEFEMFRKIEYLKTDKVDSITPTFCKKKTCNNTGWKKEN